MLALSSIENERLKMLEEFLDEHNFPKSWYCLGRGMDDAICIEPYDGKWYVYYVEHGRFENIVDHSQFEDAACDFLSRFGKGYSVPNMAALRKYLGIKDDKQSSYCVMSDEVTAVVDPREVEAKEIEISYGFSRLHSRMKKNNYERNNRAAKKTRRKEGGKTHFLGYKKTIENGLWNEGKSDFIIRSKKGKIK